MRTHFRFLPAERQETHPLYGGKAQSFRQRRSFAAGMYRCVRSYAMTALLFAAALPLSFALYEGMLCLVYGTQCRRTGSARLKPLLRSVRPKRELGERAPIRKLTALTARLVSLPPDRKRLLANRLDRLGLPWTPEEYTARGILCIAAGFLGAAVCLTASFPLGAVAAVGLGVYGFLRNRDRITDRLSQLNADILAELPRFTASLQTGLRTQRDLIAVLRRYRNVAGPALGRELDILLNDLTTGNTRVALQQFDRRLMLPEVSSLVSILIHLERGTEQGTALQNLAASLRAESREKLRRDLARRPQQMHRAMLPAIGTAVAAMFYVFLLSVWQNLSGLLT